MPIRKRGKTWHIDVTVPGGSRARFTAGRGTTREQALELEAKYRTEVHAGRVGRASSHTLSEAFTRWLNGEAKGLAFYADIVNKVAAWQPHIVGRRVQDAIAAAEQGKAAWREAGLSVITINRRVAALRRVVNLAAEWGWLDRPVKIKMAGREEPRTVRLSPAQMRALLAAFDDRHARDLVLLDALTGLRPGELRRLTADLRGVDGGWKLERRRLVLMATKTGRERSVPLAPAALAIARRALPSTVTPDRLRYAFESARDRAKMPWLQQRDIRRTFGSWIVQRTKNLKVAQDLLGHQNIAVTARHYALLLDEHLERAVDRLPRFRVTTASQGRKKKYA